LCNKQIDRPTGTGPDDSAWFDNAAISDNTRQKIGRTNAERLFGLKR
jgi:predicted TIM-barrel fold metal-dependent hydrolase